MDALTNKQVLKIIAPFSSNSAVVVCTKSRFGMCSSIIPNIWTHLQFKYMVLVLVKCTDLVLVLLYLINLWTGFAKPWVEFPSTSL